MANRDRHRQGLVYGPVRPSGPRDRGRIVGNLLGFLVVVVTVSVLALAIYLFIQARNAEPPPAATTPPASAAVSPSATASVTSSLGPSPSALAVATPTPTLQPTAQPTPPPTAPATPATPATPGPTLFVPPVMQGPGFITFGTQVDSQFRIVDPRTTFSADQPILWSAYLTEPANSTDLRIRILKLDASQPTGQQLVREEAVTPRADGISIFFHRFKLNGSGPGLYTIQYVKGENILSTGSFLVQ